AGGRNATINSNTVEENGYLGSGGITLKTLAAYPAYMCTSNVSVTGNTIRNNIGLGFWLYTEPGTSAYSIDYLNNTYTGNNGAGDQYQPTTPPPPGSCP